MRHLWIVLIILSGSFPWHLATAQKVEQTITAESQRYSLTVPGDWYVTNQAYLVGIQDLFPSESISVADSQVTLETYGSQMNLDALSVPSGFSGAMVLGVIWPQGLLEAVGLTVESLGTTVSLALGFGVDNEEFSVPDLKGTLYKSSSDAGELWAAVLGDKSGNGTILIAVSDAAHLADLEGVFTGIEYHVEVAQSVLDTERLETELEVVSDSLAIDLPPGWWTLAAEGQLMTMPSFNWAFVEGFQTSQFEGTSGLVILALPREKSDLPPESYNPDGTLNPQAGAGLLNIGSALGLGDGEFQPLERAQVWTGSYELTGLSMVLGTADGNMIAYIVVIDGGDDLVMLVSMASADAWENYRPAIEAIFATARLLSEE
jgi:hypothetical protein